jgi:hypothetical protein
MASKFLNQGHMAGKFLKTKPLTIQYTITDAECLTIECGRLRVHIVIIDGIVCMTTILRSDLVRIMVQISVKNIVIVTYKDIRVKIAIVDNDFHMTRHMSRLGNNTKMIIDANNDHTLIRLRLEPTREPGDSSHMTKPGFAAEQYVVDHGHCVKCGEKGMRMFANPHVPYGDIICIHCFAIYQVKTVIFDDQKTETVEFPLKMTDKLLEFSKNKEIIMLVVRLDHIETYDCFFDRIGVVHMEHGMGHGMAEDCYKVETHKGKKMLYVPYAGVDWIVNEMHSYHLNLTG